MKSTQSQKNVGGIAANSFMRPIIVMLAIIDIAIIGLFLRITAETRQLSSVMSNVGVYVGEANSILASTSLLSQTVANFVLVPVKKNGEFNVYPLTLYADELRRPRRGSQVMERFRDYEISEKVRSYLSSAAEDADRMTDIQLHDYAKSFVSYI